MVERDYHAYNAVGNVLQSHLTATATYDARETNSYQNPGSTTPTTRRATSSPRRNASGATTASSSIPIGQLVRIDLPDGTVASYASMASAAGYRGPPMARRPSPSARHPRRYEDGAQVAAYTHGPRLDEVLADSPGSLDLHR